MINMNSIITLSNKPEVTDLCGEKVMVDFSHGKYFMLKGAGNDIWDILEDGISVVQIVEKLLEEYEVDRTTCEKSTISFLVSLEELGFIEGK